MRARAYVRVRAYACVGARMCTRVPRDASSMRGSQSGNQKMPPRSQKSSSSPGLRPGSSRDFSDFPSITEVFGFFAPKFCCLARFFRLSSTCDGFFWGFGIEAPPLDALARDVRTRACAQVRTCAYVCVKTGGLSSWRAGSARFAVGGAVRHSGASCLRLRV